MRRIDLRPVVQRFPEVGEGQLFLDPAEDDAFSERVRAGRVTTEIFRLLLAVTRPGEQVVDAGANVGTVAVPMAMAGRRVLAIEALAANYVALATAASRAAGRLLPLHAAVAGATGTLAMGGVSAYGHVVVDSDGETPALPVDVLCAATGFERAAAVKLDVEGSELDALEGMTELLRSSHLRVLVFEANGAHCERVGHRPHVLVDRVLDAGMEVYLLRGRGFVPVGRRLFQPFGNVDYVAVAPGTPWPPEGYDLATLDRAEVVDGILWCLRHASPRYRRFMVAELDRAAPDVADEPVVREAVRAAVAGLTA